MKGFLNPLLIVCSALLISSKPNNLVTPDNKNPEDNVGLTLPQGFKATVFADNLGHARHLVVNSNGDVYVKLERLKDGKGIYRLRRTNASGLVSKTGFGNYIGTGIAIRNGYLYATSNTTIYR